MSTLSVDECIAYLHLQGIEVVHPTAAPNGVRSLCDGLNAEYSMGLHAGACCVVLAASALGCVIPIITKYVKFLRSNPFVFVVGKTAATGVLLSVATIHLIHEGTMAFNEPCVLPFFKSYSAFSFLFALIAVLLMQALDLKLAEIAERWARAKHDRGLRAGSHDESKEDSAHAENPPPSPKIKSGDEQATTTGVKEGCCCCEREECLVYTDAEIKEPGGSACCHNDDNHGDACHGHQHLTVLPPEEMGRLRRIIAAVSMEFGVALHSVFVGIAVGLTTDHELKPLLVALIFHQSFEGMAMGSRLVDASFNRKLEVALVLVFVLSAPLGMAAAIIAVSASPNAMSGGGFVTMTAILDSFCGGILLYLAFTLLLGDFVADVKQFSSTDTKGATRRKITMYAAVWIGMLIMAAVGKWL